MYSLGIYPNEFNPNILFYFKTKLSKATYVTKTHQHDFLIISYIVSGSCRYIIDGDSYVASKDDIVIIPPNTTYEGSLSTDDITLFNIGINNIKLCGYKDNTLNNDTPVITMKKFKQDLYNCYHDIISVQEKKDIGWELLIKTIILKYIVIILKELYPVTNQNIKDYFKFDSYDKNTVVSTIKTYIHENYMNKISVDEIAQSSYLSSTYISKIFKEATGDTIINYLINIRLEKAKEILEEDYFPIQEISKKVGYEDQYYFSKLFKKKYGCSPSNYKAEKSMSF